MVLILTFVSQIVFLDLISISWHSGWLVFDVVFNDLLGNSVKEFLCYFILLTNQLFAMLF